MEATSKNTRRPNELLIEMLVGLIVYFTIVYFSGIDQTNPLIHLVLLLLLIVFLSYKLYQQLEFVKEIIYFFIGYLERKIPDYFWIKIGLSKLTKKSNSSEQPKSNVLNIETIVPFSEQRSILPINETVSVVEAEHKHNKDKSEAISEHEAKVSDKILVEKISISGLDTVKKNQEFAKMLLAFQLFRYKKRQANLDDPKLKTYYYSLFRNHIETDIQKCELINIDREWGQLYIDDLVAKTISELKKCNYTFSISKDKIKSIDEFLGFIGSTTKIQVEINSEINREIIIQLLYFSLFSLTKDDEQERQISDTDITPITLEKESQDMILLYLNRKLKNKKSH